jgi:hypothetical protein
MDAALIVTLVFSIISAVCVVVELIITVNNHRKERTVQTVTEQRSSWIQSLRSLFVEIVDLLDHSIDSLITLEREMASPNHRPNDGQEFCVNELRNRYVKLRLLLNFENEIDKELLATLEDLICRIDLEVIYSYIVGFDDYNIKDFVAEKELLVLYMSMYLKAEWERLKQESKTGEADSKYFETKYHELEDSNRSLIIELKNRAYRVKLADIKQFIESNPQYKSINIATYNCLNILDSSEK